MNMNDLTNALEVCMVRLKNGETPTQVLADYPDTRAELAPLLELATQMSNAALAFSPDAQTRLETQLRGALRAQQIRQPRNFSFGVWALRAAIAALVVLLVIGIGSVGTAQAQPGDYLFPVRLFANQTRVQYVSDPRASLELRLDLLEDRMAEQLYRVQKQEWGPAESLLLLSEMDSMITLIENQPEIVGRAEARRITSLAETERRFLDDRLAQAGNHIRIRRMIEATLQIVDSWQPTVERLKQKFP